MNPPSEDRRKLRTRAALLKAFDALFLELGYEALTVAQVAERADVGRSTLYEHFRTKDDLLQASLHGRLDAFAAATSPDADPRALPALLEHIRASAAVTRRLLAQPMRSRIARLLAEQIQASLVLRGVHPPVAALRAIAVAEAQLALAERWVFGPVALSAQAMAEELARLSRAVVAQ